MQINLLDRFPRSERPVEERGEAVTDEVRRVAREFGWQFFDGPRLYGAGGYHYDPRFWTGTVERLRDHYSLPLDASVLDVGCAKGFLLYDLKRAMPGVTVAGLDISSYAIDLALPEVRPYLTVGSADRLPYPDRSFDLVVSINTIHNLPEEGCRQAVREIVRVMKERAFVCMDSWSTERGRERLMKWNLTALTLLDMDGWRRLLEEEGYQGDYWFWTLEVEDA